MRFDPVGQICRQMGCAVMGPWFHDALFSVPWPEVFWQCCSLWVFGWHNMRSVPLTLTCAVLYIIVLTLSFIRCNHVMLRSLLDLDVAAIWPWGMRLPQPMATEKRFSKADTGETENAHSESPLAESPPVAISLAALHKRSSPLNLSDWVGNDEAHVSAFRVIEGGMHDESFVAVSHMPSSSCYVFVRLKHIYIYIGPSPLVMRPKWGKHKLNKSTGAMGSLRDNNISGLLAIQTTIHPRPSELIPWPG